MLIESILNTMNLFLELDEHFSTQIIQVADIIAHTSRPWEMFMTSTNEKKLLDEADDPRFQLTSIERHLVKEKIVDLETLRFYQKREF